MKGASDRKVKQELTDGHSLDGEQWHCESEFLRVLTKHVIVKSP